MMSLSTCDLLKGCADVLPVIDHYRLSPLDNAVNTLATTTYSAHHKILMTYWDKYKVEMAEIFEATYPRNDVPEWVEYDGFKHDKLIEMADELFEGLYDPLYRYGGQGEFMNIDFSEVLGFAFCTRQMDYNATSRATDMISITMVVNAIMMDETVAKKPLRDVFCGKNS